MNLRLPISDCRLGEEGRRPPGRPGDGRRAGQPVAVALGVLLLLTLLVHARLAAAAADPGVGDRAPAFTLPASTGGVVSLADFAGKRHVILAFYIQDFTPG